MNTEQSDYRFNLIKTLQTLKDFEEELFNDGINLLMTGELREVHDVFEVGDTYEFNFNHLESSEDMNIKKIVELLKLTDEFKNNISNINNIDDEEYMDD